MPETPIDDIINRHSSRQSRNGQHRATEQLGLVPASEIQPERVDYLDEGLIPLRVVTLVTGLDGVGKSTLLYAKAAQATRGKLQGLFKGTPVDVVIASSEDHAASVIVPRLMAAGADLDHVHIVKVRRDGLDGDIALPDDLPALATAIEAIDARFVIIDPLIAHLPLHIDSYKAQHVRSVLAPLARLAEDAELAVAAVVHFNGSPSTDVRFRISGSKALRDAARSVIVCGVDPTDESRCVMVQDKFSFGPKPTTGRAYRIQSEIVGYGGEEFMTSRLVWLGEVEIDSRGLLAGPGDPEERNDLDRAVVLLESLVEPGNRIEPREAEKAGKDAEGLDAKTLQRARRRLGWAVESEGFRPKAWYWVRPRTGQGPVSTTEEAEAVQYEETLTSQGEEASESPVVDTVESVSTTDEEPDDSDTDDAMPENGGDRPRPGGWWNPGDLPVS